MIDKLHYGSAHNTYRYKCLYKEQAKQASSKTANKNQTFKRHFCSTYICTLYTGQTILHRCIHDHSQLLLLIKPTKTVYS